MDYLISNLEISGTARYGDLYFQGPCVKVVSEKLLVRKSAHWKDFGRFAEDLVQAAVNVPFNSDDFYFLADYDAAQSALQFQTDLVGYEAAFFWKDGDAFALSDDMLFLAKCLKDNGVDISFDEDHVRQYIYYSECLFEDTIFHGIQRLLPASIGTIDIKNGALTQDIYDHFKMQGTYATPEECAEHLESYLSKYFQAHASKGVTFSIGMSGGLDSRVGAFFAKQCDYAVDPIFFGVKKNRFGLKTNDVKRGEAINEELGFPEIQFFDPRTVSLREKVTYDTLNAAGIVSNISQNMGRVGSFDVLIHAMMGGEAFGQLVHQDMAHMNTAELSECLLNMISCKPQYKVKSKLLRRMYRYFHVGKWILCDPQTEQELMPPELKEQALQRVRHWVEQQKGLGLDGLNICHKYFYYRFAVIAKYGYYSTLNNTVPSLATYMNQGFISEMLNWDSRFLIGKKVQTALLLRLGNLSSYRSQTVEAAQQKTGFARRIRKPLYVLERLLRGGAMEYGDWFSEAEIKDYLRQYVAPTQIGQKIALIDPVWIYGSLSIMMLMKVSFVEEYLSLD